MSFSQAAASNVVPLIARIVLGAAFITAGWNKIMTDRSFSGDSVRKLREMGVVGDSTASRDASSAGEWEIRLVSWQDQGTGDADAGTGGSDQDTGAVDAGAPADDEADDDAATTTPPPVTTPATVEVRSVYGVALMLYDAGWSSYAKLLAWVAALTELVGGILILVGMFTRLWAVGLAITMVVAFYLTSMTAVTDTLVLDLLSDPRYGVVTFNQVFAQLGLFALAFGVLLTGPGGASIDRAIFRKRGEGLDEPGESSA